MCQLPYVNLSVKKKEDASSFPEDKKSADFVVLDKKGRHPAVYGCPDGSFGQFLRIKSAHPLLSSYAHRLSSAPLGRVSRRGAPSARVEEPGVARLCMPLRSQQSSTWALTPYGAASPRLRPVGAPALAAGSVWPLRVALADVWVTRGTRPCGGPST